MRTGNPLITIFLGWFVAHEPVNLRIILSTVIITLSVVLILDDRCTLGSTSRQYLALRILDSTFLKNVAFHSVLSRLDDLIARAPGCSFED